MRACDSQQAERLETVEGVDRDAANLVVAQDAVEENRQGHRP